MARKSRFRRKLRDVGRKAARIGSVAAPIIGGAVLGPAGAVAGGAVGASLSQVHQRRGSKRARLRRSLLATGASVGVSGAASLLGGGGLATGILPNLKNIFGGQSSPAPAGTPEEKVLDFGQDLGKSNAQPSVGGAATGGSIFDILSRGSQTLPPGTGANGSAGDPQGATAGGVFPGAGPDLLSATGEGGEEDGGRRMLLILAIGAGVLLLSKKK